MEAQDYKKMVKALTCGNDGKIPCHNNECSYWVDQWHGIGLCNVIKKDADAAAAIEALQADIKRLKEATDELREAQTYIDHYGDKWLTSAKDVPTAAYEHGYADGRAEAEAQLPKRGKWIYKPKDAIEMMFTLPKCSVCGHESSDANNYCPNCGADMRKMEVQE